MTDETNAPQFWADSQPGIGAGGNPQQAREMADAMVHHGTISRADADAALQRAGHQPAQADTRTEDAKAFDQTFGAAPPTEYRVDYMGRLPAGTETGTVAQFNRYATEWLSATGFPPGLGESVIQGAMDAGQRASRMDPVTLELWKREQTVVFDRIAGSPERAAALRAYADAALARGGADFSSGLRKSGAVHDAAVLMNLALQGERLSKRSAM